MKEKLRISVLHIGSMHPDLPRATLRKPIWKQIEDAVIQMDGHGRCEVAIVVDEEHYLLLGGGADDRYVCQAENSEGNFVLCDLSQPEGKVVPINDGQPSLYESGHVVDRGKVLQATRYFATRLGMDPSLVWHQY